MGTVLSVSKQWWCKINTRPLRSHAMDGAAFPHIIKVVYTVNDKKYTRRAWVLPEVECPGVGAAVGVFYAKDKPSKSKILL